MSGNLLGVPLAAKDPDAFRSELAFDAFEYLQGVRSFTTGLEEQLSSPQLMRLSRERLKKIRDDYKKHLEIMSRMLEPLGYDQIQGTAYSRLLNRKSKGHRVIEYYSHLCKDWAWGGGEAEAGLNLIQKVWPIAEKPQNVLILGAGACRLPYELHRWLRPALSLCVDINPLLLSCARRLMRGEKLNLVEFPSVPRDKNTFSVCSELSAPETLHDGIEFLVHDIGQWGFKAKSFDVVITPWFIDVAPIPAARLFALINSALRDGGRWINYGPLLFNKLRLADYYSLEEALYLVEKSGFAIAPGEWLYETVPHMQNPASAHGRVERVLTFCAQKTADCDVPEVEAEPEWPAWLLDPSQPINLKMPLDELQMSLGFTLDLSIKATGGLSIKELAKVMGARHGMGEANAEFLITSTLKVWLSSEQYNPHAR